MRLSTAVAQHFINNNNNKNNKHPLMDPQDKACGGVGVIWQQNSTCTTESNNHVESVSCDDFQEKYIIPDHSSNNQPPKKQNLTFYFFQIFERNQKKSHTKNLFRIQAWRGLNGGNSRAVPDCQRSNIDPDHIVPGRYEDKWQKHTVRNP